jgi:hypothetical protein
VCGCNDVLETLNLRSCCNAIWDRGFQKHIQSHIVTIVKDAHMLFVVAWMVGVVVAISQSELVLM